MTGASLLTPQSPLESLPYSRILMEGAGDLFGAQNLVAIIRGLPFDSIPLADPSEELDRLAAGFSFDEARSFPALLEQVYGRRGGQGLALRVGRAVFTTLLKHFGRDYGLIDASFRLLPPSRRVEEGLNRLAEIFNQAFGQNVSIEQDDTHWVWIACDCLNCPNAYDEQAAQGPSCFLMIGVLQAFLSWESGGRFYSIRETECAASGGCRCRFLIDKKPLDG